MNNSLPNISVKVLHDGDFKEFSKPEKSKNHYLTAESVIFFQLLKKSYCIFIFDCLLFILKCHFHYRTLFD